MDIYIFNLPLPSNLNDKVNEFVLPQLLQMCVRDKETHIVSLRKQVNNEQINTHTVQYNTTN